jgi:hypothetical protein
MGSPWLAPRIARLPWVPLAVLLSLPLFGWLSLQLGQDANWDLRNYHFYNPWAFLGHRLAIDILPAQAQTFFNPMLDLPFYWLVTHASPRAVGFVLGAVHGLNFWLLYLIGMELLPKSVRFRPALALLAAGAGFFGPVGAGELGSTKNDNLAGLFVLGAVYALARGLRRRAPRDAPSRRHVLAAAALAGAGAGLKYSQVPYALGLLAALAFAGGRIRTRLDRILLGGLAVGASFLLTAGPWMLRLRHRFASPLFPFLNSWFRSPYYHFGVSWNDHRWWPKGTADWVLRPFYLASAGHASMEYPFRDFRFAVLALLIVAAVAVRLRARRWQTRDPGPAAGDALAALLCFAVVSFAAWEMLLSYYRSLYPLEALAPLLIAALVLDLVRRPGWSEAAAAPLLLAIALSVQPARFERVPWGNSFFGVKVPDDPDLSRAVVVLASEEPTAYLLPFFPPGSRFVHVASNFTGPGDSDRFEAEIRDLLYAHRGPLFVLSEGAEDEERLAAYRLAVDAERCRPVATRLDATPPLLCRAHRLPRPRDARE